MRTSRFYTMVLTGIAAIVLAGCSKPHAAAPEEPPAPTVDVAEVVHELFAEWDEFTGRLEAPETVRLIPRVSGYIQNVAFKEGSLVKQGDLLFQIDAAPMIAEVERLRADLQSAETARALAEKDYRRAAELHEKRAISEELLDSRLAQKQQAASAVASVRAALDRAELDLAYTRVTAPIDGRISLAQVTAGNYVHAGQSPLTSIVSVDHMYAYFDIDEQAFLKYAHLAETGQRPDDRGATNKVFMALANEQEYPHQGHIDFVDNAVNRNTGTVRVRATFNNDDKNLLPGLFARIKVVGSAPYEGILIDEKAIGTDLDKKYVLLVNAQNQVEYRAIKLGEKIGGLRIVTEGLKPGDQIVVNGLQRVTPNMTVEPNPVAMATAEELTGLRMVQQALAPSPNDIFAQAAH